MNSFKQYYLLSLVSLFFLILNISAIDPLFSSCSISSNYTITDPFDENLNQLMFQLTTGSPCTGFSLGSIDIQGPNKANGLVLCRGDINTTACKSCIDNANNNIRNLCPYKKEAFVYFDECLLRYSNSVFFGEIDDQHTFAIANTQNVSSSQVEFNGQVMQLMDSLKTEAYGSQLFFAAREIEIGGSEKLYGLAQCTRDLSEEGCNKCLESAIAQLPGCCAGKRGGRVAGGSCNVRYELYPFYNNA